MPLKVVDVGKVLEPNMSLVAWPDNWPSFYNCNVPCDMLVGPCLCGAWHGEGEFELVDGVVCRAAYVEKSPRPSGSTKVT